MKYLPAFSIIGINMMIAWKMRVIANARREIHRDDINDAQALSGSDITSG